MRDDLHKKAPIPRKAQSVLKLAGRPADRCHPERLRDAAIAALDQLVRRSFSPETVEALKGGDRQRELFGVGEGRQACSPTEADLFTQMGASKGGDACASLERALLNLTDSYRREVCATLVAEGPVRDFRQVVSAFTEAFETAAGAVSRNICLGEALPAGNHHVTLDEDLRSTRSMGAS